MKKPARIPDCHPDRKHKGLGLCVSCYKMYRIKNNPKLLENKKKYMREYQSNKRKTDQEYHDKQLKGARIYKQKHRDKLNSDRNKYYYSHKEKENLTSKLYKQNNLEKVKVQSKIYVQNNLDKICNRMKKKYHSDPIYRLKVTIRSRFYYAIHVCKAPKFNSVMKLIGCTIDELKVHLETQFKPGMIWENYGKNGWEIDHIRPCLSFNLFDEEEQKQCFHYTNLQPLWWYENRSKNDKYEKESENTV
jgi:hypothetical protein